MMEVDWTRFRELVSKAWWWDDVGKVGLWIVATLMNRLIVFFKTRRLIFLID